MSEKNQSKQRSVGRPRSEASKTAILNATIDLLEETGYSSLTIEAIAARAGVGKATIYRWWPNKSILVLDAFLMSTESRLYFQENTSIHENFRQQLQALADVFNGILGRTVVALVAEGGEDSEIAKIFYTNYLKPRREDAILILERAVARGEIQAGINLDVVSDMLYGPVYFQILIYKKKVDSKFIDTLVDQVMKGIVAP
ncbi:TetR/AcrR family transcriptional regulator [Bacillus sp. AFS055030]|uniref:TetR/AcrR family transcriptional regulator n=1 Tax=Bacillus sp. AFS055030 TaxID=2033507 RepID=UPI000BFC05F4|nr:TetR/AcrR family transcriptional regulator [Bacillus sp. AFS055030]PGL68975.1 TetR family transcriptional regulator [Bacillus sp. AFS055030]